MDDWIIGCVWDNELMLRPEDSKFTSIRHILMLAGPLVLSHFSFMFMNLVDGLFLARYDQNAIAAIGPAGMTFWLIIGLFIGLCGYTGTFVAQYVGAKRLERVGAAVWQGMYLALVSGLLIAVCTPLTVNVFSWTGHHPDVARLEATYFQIMSWGACGFLLSSALSGFFAGRNDNVTLMVVHLTGAALNALLDWLLVFGIAGFPEMGIAGAAWATVIAHIFIVLAFLILFLRKKHQQAFGTWADRSLDMALMIRLCRFGLPSGVRLVIEILAWTLFLMILGRTDPTSLAASNIVWRLNGVAFFPIIGLSVAISMLVGQAQGADRPDQSERIMWRGLWISQVWMTAIAAMFVIIPQTLIAPFLNAEKLDPAAYDQLMFLSVVLLRFVALYCLMDGLNIILIRSIAGGRRHPLDHDHLDGGPSALCPGTAGDRLPAGDVYVFWSAATVFVMSIALLWVFRVRSGKWKPMRVIEQVPIELEPATPTSG
ncbi:MAG: MATE family efflux transporter [Phycisphaerales bacterium]|nr:MATE family efflux transporter [Phycisphaerales bacterium]